MEELRKLLQANAHGLYESVTTDNGEEKIVSLGRLIHCDKENSEVDVIFSTGGRGVNGSQFRKQSANLRSLYEKAKELGVLQTTKERGILPKREDENRNRWHARSSKVSKKIYEPLLENGFLQLEKTIRKKYKEIEAVKKLNEKLLSENKSLKERLATSEEALSLLSNMRTNEQLNENQEQNVPRTDQSYSTNQILAESDEEIKYFGISDDQEQTKENAISSCLENQHHSARFAIEDSNEIDHFQIFHDNDIGISVLEDLHPESSSNIFLGNVRDIFDGPEQLLFN